MPRQLRRQPILLRQLRFPASAEKAVSTTLSLSLLRRRCWCWCRCWCGCHAGEVRQDDLPWRSVRCAHKRAATASLYCVIIGCIGVTLADGCGFADDVPAATEDYRQRLTVAVALGVDEVPSARSGTRLKGPIAQSRRLGNRHELCIQCFRGHLQ